MHTKHFLICYDISDKTRLRRVHKLMCDFACPVQLSVFRADLTTVRLEQLLAQLKKLINQKEDKISFYPVTSGDVLSLGQAPMPDSVVIF